MNAHQFASDWDHQDAMYPKQAAYAAWCEAYLIEALKADEIETAVSVTENLPSEFDAFVHLLAFQAPMFRPLALTEFRRVIDGMTSTELQEALDDGEIDPLEIVRLALFASDETRRGWPVVVRAGADWLHDRIVDAAPNWGVVERIYERRNEL